MRSQQISKRNAFNKRPLKKRRLDESVKSVKSVKSVPSSYRKFNVLGNHVWVKPNRLCQLRFESETVSVISRHLETWTDVQIAIDSLCKLIGTLPRNESVVITTLFQQNNWDNIMSKQPGKQTPIIWIPEKGLCLSFTV